MVWRFLKILGIKSPYDPEISLLGTYPAETRVEKDTCIPLLIAALFTIARTWKQPKCPSTDEQIKKMWCIYTMGYYTMKYYSVIKKNEILSSVVIRIDLEVIILSEVSQEEKYYLTYLICRI